APNDGFVILPERISFNDDGIEIYSSEDGDPSLRPSLAVEFIYDVENVAPSVTQSLTGPSEVDEGREGILMMGASDPNPLDPLVFSIDSVDVGFATGGATIEHPVLFQDEGAFTFNASVRDDTTSVSLGSHTVIVHNLDPEILDIGFPSRAVVGEAIAFSAEAVDAGVFDVLSYTWDLDGDGQLNDFDAASGEWTFDASGTTTVTLRVSDGDGGEAIASIQVDVIDVLPGDANCDGGVDGLDIDAFTLALLDVDAYAVGFSDCPIENSDFDSDGAVTYADIAGFAVLLLNQP
ncbi:MAG: PKD domain-containing protein, partial [Phycisphaerales bacterium]|nr:PKD domain-containing protein [Phycisphaerales bacterium]